MSWGLVAATAFVLGGGQEGPFLADPGSEVRVRDAIRKGVEHLRSEAPRLASGAMSSRELVLLAMAQGGLSEKDPEFADLFRKMMEERPQTTYRTALRAMVLEEVDRAKHQLRIHECAQFLADNQAQNGQWSYGEPTVWRPPEEDRRAEPTEGRFPPAGTLVRFGDAGGFSKPPVVRKIPVRKQRDGPPCGDNSNSQYAALGIRACHEAGIVFPRELIVRAAQWWRQSQIGEAGTIRGGRVSTGSGPRPRGWGYRGPGEEAYGSMTAGAVGALVICDYLLGTDWRRDENVNSGIRWIQDHFSVEENPRMGRLHHYYYLYALERAGVLYGIESFGGRSWYSEGASLLLREQRSDGSWGNLVDTCFAILFLRKATRPLVASGDSRNP